MNVRQPLLCGIVCLVAVAIGCRHSLVPAMISPAPALEAEHVAAAHPAGSAAARVARPAQDWSLPGSIHPNEVGLIPVAEYHDISSSERYMGRSIAHFKRDLERLYKEGYRPISMSEFLDNRIDLPAGTSPVLLTFDDARNSQFAYRPDGSLDPNCAVAILQEFHSRHPDFAAKATFFVLPKNAFGQPKLINAKLQALLDMGFDIGNHTADHAYLNRLSDRDVQREIAMGKELIQEIVPAAHVDTLAFPGGLEPRNRRLGMRGYSGPVSYRNRAAFLASYAPSPAPASTKLDRERIPRIVGDDKEFGITDWLDRLKKHPEQRYVSDGDVTTVCVPKSLLNEVDRRKLHGASVSSY